MQKFLLPALQKNFFQQPKRFPELLRTATPAEAAEQTFRYIVSACPKPPARQTGVVNGEIIFLFLNGMHALFTCFYSVTQ